MNSQNNSGEKPFHAGNLKKGAVEAWLLSLAERSQFTMRVELVQAPNAAFGEADAWTLHTFGSGLFAELVQSIIMGPSLQPI